MFKFSRGTFQSSSEFVSSGHPDRLADNIAAKLIQDIQRKDGVSSHAAIEVFISHDTITIGGEAKTSLSLDIPYLKDVVREAFKVSGYVPEMRNYWKRCECMLSNNFRIINKIVPQSPDIAKGTTSLAENSGWNDQGIYFSSSDCTTSNYLGFAHNIAQTIGEVLKEVSFASVMNNGKDIGGVVLGPDNKCVVTVKVKEDGITPIEVSGIVIAVAHSSNSDVMKVREIVRCLVEDLLESLGVPLAKDINWVINGTGRFVIHGPVSDTSMTGRKISVNHPSAGPVWANKMIGGGSLVKPAHASDFILNVVSRFIANVIVQANLSKYAIVGCSGAIGVQGIQSLFIKDDGSNSVKKLNKIKDFFINSIDWAPIKIATQFGVFSEGFNFLDVVNNNFFGHGECQPWDNKGIIGIKAKELLSVL